MKKERIKSFALAILIIANIMLSGKILVYKKLWLFSYNFFVNVKNSRKSTYSLANTITLPDKIVVNTGYQSSRFNYTRNMSEFESINEAAADILKKAFASKTCASVSADEWYSVLTAKSVYLSYPCKYSSQIFAGFLGGTTDLNFEGFSDIAINENGNVYVCDKTGYYRIAVLSDDISPIIRDVAAKHENEESVINYSFDLNFDKDFADQKTFLSPMILIYSEPVEAKNMLCTNPVYKSDGEINNKTIEGIFSAFALIPNTVFSYTEADGSLIFVENNGILKISEDGILSFEANNTGIRIGNLTESNAKASRVAEFIDNVNRSAGVENDKCLTSDILSDNTEIFSFDYMADGFRVKYRERIAISVEIADNSIMKYTQILRHYTPTGEAVVSPAYIDTLDNVILKYRQSMNEIRIKDMYPAYLDDETSDEISLNWYMDIDDVIAE